VIKRKKEIKKNKLTEDGYKERYKITKQRQRKGKESNKTNEGMQ
jgi:hypothetical protein